MPLQSPYKRVIVLALDGVGRFFTEVPTPAFDAFFASGASSLKAKAVVPTDSAQNWGSILHGVLPEKHGLKNGDVEAGVPYKEDDPYPSIYKILGNSSKDIKMASYVAWEAINTGIIELSVKTDLYAPLTHENVLWKWWLRFKHHWLKDSVYDYTVISRLVDYIRNPENKDVELLLVHLTDVDEHGHGHGYGSQPYLEQIKIMDSQVATILETIEEVGWKDDSLIVMTTDHGGIGTQHGGDSDVEVNVFLAVSGAGIEPNSKIESEVTNMDCAAIILKGLGKEIPEWFDAKLPAEFSSKNGISSTIEVSSNKPTGQTKNYGLCPACGGPKTSSNWCPPCCSQLLLEDNLKNPSGDEDIDNFIRETITSARRSYDYLEFIPYENFKDIKKIGEGGFAVASLATRTNCLKGHFEWDEVAKKYVRHSYKDYRIALKSFRNRPNIAKEFLNEIKTHHKCMMLQEDEFLQCYGISRNPVTKEFIIVLDYAQYGDLRQFLQQNHKTLKWEDKLKFTTKIIQDLKVIHEAGLIHCDFHSGNILQISNYPRVSDFGLSRADQDFVPDGGIYGVVPYMAPEILSGKPYRQAADVYSFGIIMWEITSGKPAFYDTPHDYQLILKIIDGNRPPIVKSTPSCYLKLMQRCLDNEPKNRPTATEIYEICHEWYNCVKEQKVETEIYQQFAKSDEMPYEEEGNIIEYNRNQYTSKLVHYTNKIITNNYDSKQFDLCL
ncbi:kinase-like domain-containing protein [Rhizophagus diaphanus]|nr:kinase-like domain-containing protein [Rhizophagus diaphanus] [Rhizophagus sp. MUCL 43196]